MVAKLPSHGLGSRPVYIYIKEYKNLFSGLASSLCQSHRKNKRALVFNLNCTASMAAVAVRGEARSAAASDSVTHWHPRLWASARWGVHVNANYAIYRLLHILQTTPHYYILHISAYLFFHIWVIQSMYLHILCIFIAYYWLYLHIFRKELHVAFMFVHISCIFHAYSTNTVYIWILFVYLVHITVYL